MPLMKLQTNFDSLNYFAGMKDGACPKSQSVTFCWRCKLWT